ncbi:hypothetical protein EC957_004131 [Mortierella hygrophila]|uniref:Uncharacterized protein n=1 Tax=Mortierella hygrophila TaxID=979708 RepID=A0A9P6FIU8_9FUNG|nr:hypothetical protein EC957_004131 [Mortierella hygrophila]
MSIVETFHGYIETTQDTLLIFEACRRGFLPRICRRLQEKERRLVQSGTVFVFDERESGIKRWTDGLVWSPSRILGNFLVYRELDKRNSGKKDASPIDRSERSSSSDNETAIEKNQERALVGSLTNSYRFKKNGLIKKTMSIVVNGVPQHMISYYTKDDVLAGKLRTPSSVPEFASLEISPEFLMKQNFRIPPTVEQSYDHLADHMHSPVSNHSPRTPSGVFTHTMGTNGTDFSSHGFNHHPRTKIEPDLVSTSLDVFSKPYHQQSHHPLHPQQNYHTLTHLANTQPQQHNTSHSYSSHSSPFSSNFGYNSVPSAASDVTATTPPPIRYLPRSAPILPYHTQASSQSTPTSQTQHPTQQSHHHQQQQQQQPQQSYMSHHRHSMPPGHYGAGSPVMMMASPNPGSNGSTSHEFGLTMGYQSPAPTGTSSTFGGFSGDSPQLGHSQSSSQQQHYHHSLPPSTQSWGDFGYSSYSSSAALGPISDHQHDQQSHDQLSASP